MHIRPTCGTASWLSCRTCGLPAWRRFRRAIACSRLPHAGYGATRALSGASPNQAVRDHCFFVSHDGRTKIMINVRTLIFVAPLLASAHAAAQAPQSASPGSAIVFKCTSADGSVTFSDVPCAAAQKSQTVDTSRALRTSSGGHQEQIASSVADSDCRRGAQRSAYASIDMKIEESNRHIADYQQRLGAL